MEKEIRPEPKIAANIRSPSADISILEYYKPYYDAAFIILHPFIKIVNESRLYSDGNNKMPTKNNYMKYTEGVSWQEFLEISGLKSINQLDIALRSLIGGLVEEHRNEEDVNIVKRTMEEYNLIEPGEGCFSRLLLDEMMTALLELDHKWLYVGDEFGFERRIEFIEDIIENKTPISFGHENWYTTMNEILYATHWDSHFTLLCADKQTVETILQKHKFEGFYCNLNTEVYWSLSKNRSK